MIVNLYIDTRTSERRLLLENLLRDNGYAFFDSTQYDPCTSGSCSLNTLEDIEHAITGE